MLQWITSNKEWLFSGVGVVVFTSVAGLLVRRKPLPTILELEQELQVRGFTGEVRAAIRSSKICIIDDKIADLKSLTDGLRREGFSNLVEFPKVESVAAILNADFDLVVLDLKGVAEEVCEDDGIGVLARVKHIDPALPVLIITGTATPASAARKLNEADLIRSKPVLPGDFAADVEELLRTRKDPYWAALATLKSSAKLDGTALSALGTPDRVRLWYYRRRLLRRIQEVNPDAAADARRIAAIVAKVGSTTSTFHHDSVGGHR